MVQQYFDWISNNASRACHLQSLKSQQWAICILSPIWFIKKGVQCFTSVLSNLIHSCECWTKFRNHSACRRKTSYVQSARDSIKMKNEENPVIRIAHDFYQNQILNLQEVSALCLRSVARHSTQATSEQSKYSGSDNYKNIMRLLRNINSSNHPNAKPVRLSSCLGGERLITFRAHPALIKQFEAAGLRDRSKLHKIKKMNTVTKYQTEIY